MSCDYSTSEMDGSTAVTESTSFRVLSAIAAKKGVEPTELDTELYSVIDAEALDQLVEKESTTVRSITFEFEGHTVTVRGNGRVLVDEVAANADEAAVEAAD